MANSRQAAKRARQSEQRRLRNMHYKSTMRTRIKGVRHAIDSFRILEAGKALHTQDVEKYLRFLCEGRAADYQGIGRSDVVTDAKEMMGNYQPDRYKAFLQKLAKANFHLAESSIRHAASKGAIHKRSADRKVSRLAIALASIS